MSVVTIVAVLVAANAGDPPPGTANLYIDRNGGSCTRHSSPAAYVDLEACPDMTSAYAAASPGDRVKIKGGVYGSQAITGVSKVTGPRVVFLPADNEVVKFNGDLNLWRGHIEVRNFELGNHDLYIREQDNGAPTPVDDMMSINLTGRNFQIFNATHVTVKGGEWGPSSSCGGAYGGGNNSIRNLNTSVNPADILIQDLVIHDAQSHNLTDCHIECFALFAGDRVTFSRVKFYNCSVYDIFVQNNSGPISALTVENSWFGSPVNTTAGDPTTPNGRTIGFSHIPADSTLKNNSFQGQMGLDDNGLGAPHTNWVMTGNAGVAQLEVCDFTDIAFSYNAWTNRSACAGTGNIGNVANPFQDDVVGKTMNLHLRSDATSLINAIPTGSAQVTKDIDGESRPIGTGVEIGSDERPTP